jgi:hypothetical protein
VVTNYRVILEEQVEAWTLNLAPGTSLGLAHVHMQQMRRIALEAKKITVTRDHVRLAIFILCKVA